MPTLWRRKANIRWRVQFIKELSRMVCLSINQLKAQGEKNIHYIPLNVPEPLLKEADYANDLTHPTAEGARKIALYLKDKVAAIMQWL